MQQKHIICALCKPAFFCGSFAANKGLKTEKLKMWIWISKCVQKWKFHLSQQPRECAAAVDWVFATNHNYDNCTLFITQMAI